MGVIQQRKSPALELASTKVIVVCQGIFVSLIFCFLNGEVCCVRCLRKAVVPCQNRIILKNFSVLF